jgi:hypothetical protein
MGSARLQERWDMVFFPPESIGVAELRWSMSPSIFTTRGWLCPSPLGNNDTNMEANI